MKTKLRVGVIGAGFIGLEAAATAKTLGNDVVVLEGAPAPLIRGLGAEMGISTSKLHAYGAMGLEELCTRKWIAYGQGQIRS